MRLLLAACLSAVLFLTACKEPDIKEDGAFAYIPPEGWIYGKTFEFLPELTDTAGFVRVAVAVRHDNDYPYSNLWLELTSPLPGVDSLRTDTLDIDIADVYGHWYGHGAAMSYIVVDTLPGDYYYETGRPFRLRHIMRTDTVPDLTQVGLLFTASENQ